MLMTEDQWLNESRYAQWMFGTVLQETKAGETESGQRKFRLFACGCCQYVRCHLGDPRLWEAVELAERFADGLETEEKVAAFRESLQSVEIGSFLPKAAHLDRSVASFMARATLDPLAESAAFEMTTMPLPLAGYQEGSRDGATIMCMLLRDVFGNPFRPVKLNEQWLSTTVSSMARVIYESREWASLPILADALEDAGCDETQILSHCRSELPHTRGCWAVDLLRGIV